MKKIDVAQLARVTGGSGEVKIGDIKMGPPKYSAEWWDFVRAGGAHQWYR